MSVNPGRGRKENTLARKFRRFALIAFSIIALVLCYFSIPVGKAHAATIPPHEAELTANAVPQSNYPPGYFYIANQRCCGEVEDPIWTVAIDAGLSGSISRTVSWSNTWGESITLSYSVVQAGLSFNINQSYSVTAGCSLNNTTNHTRYLTFYAIFNTWSFDVYDRETEPPGETFYLGYGWAKPISVRRVLRYSVTVDLGIPWAAFALKRGSRPLTKVC